MPWENADIISDDIIIITELEPLATWERELLDEEIITPAQHRQRLRESLTASLNTLATTPLAEEANTMNPRTMRAKLKFVRRTKHYSLYRDDFGQDIYLKHGTTETLVSSNSLDLNDLWRDWEYSHRISLHYQDMFKDILRNQVWDRENVDQIKFCVDCYTPLWAAQQHPIDSTGQRVACTPCFNCYLTCTECESKVRYMNNTVTHAYICEGCTSRAFAWCDHCNGYYPRSLGDEHTHEENECCESPAKDFTIRNDGETPLANDTRVTITLPAGLISDEGIGTIAAYLRNTYLIEAQELQQQAWNLSYRLNELGQGWQTKQGNFTKRLSRMAYKQFGMKLPPEVISRVGSIASEHSKAINFQIEVTRNLNGSPAAFAHEGSCWWTDYNDSRCALKTNGGFAIRTFADKNNPNGWDEGSVTGRAWVMPLRKSKTRQDGLEPTFNIDEADAFIVFNGYGNLQGYTGSRILSHMLGVTYRKVNFACSPMYINSESGYLVGAEEIVAPYTDGSISISLSTHANLFQTENLERTPANV